jgi:CubicO group peptidase (beta-lactamase class C family)
MDFTNSQCESFLESALTDYVPHVLEVTGTPGVTITITGRRGVVYSKGYGYANLADDTPMTPQNVLPIGSVSKWFVAIAVMQLAERGLLDLYAPIGQYIADFPVSNPLGARAVTVYDLLVHSSGLRTDAPAAELTRSRDLVDYLSSVLNQTQGREYSGIGALWTARVGERVQYSTLGWDILGHLVATVNPEGCSYNQYVANAIFEPLGMTSSCIPDPNSENFGSQLSDRCATGYARFGSLVFPSPVIHLAAHPGAGMLSTTEDQARWLTAALNGGRGRAGPILESRSLRQMLIPHVSRELPSGSPDPMVCGLGVQLYNLGRPDWCYGHNGARFYGWWTECRAYPQLGFAIAVGCNAWDLTRFVNPRERIAPGLITDFVARLASMPKSPARKPAGSRAWRVSYAIGLLLVDRVRGVLGIKEALTPAAIKAMMDGARHVPGWKETEWDPCGFAAGIEAGNDGVLSAAEFGAFIDSDSCCVSRDDLNLYTLEAGGSRALFPAPMEFFADRVQENLAKYGYLDEM